MTEIKYVIQSRYCDYWKSWDPAYDDEKKARQKMEEVLRDGWWKPYQIRLVKTTTTEIL
jgi:hypothetical protein